MNGFLKPAGIGPRMVGLITLYCAFAIHAQTTKPPADAAQATDKGRVIELNNAKALIPDAEVFDHNGRRVRLYSDLIKNRLVLLSFFFTDCSNICHVQGHDLARMQAALGERLGRDVSLLSISMNPAHDSPQKLKHWAKSFGVKPGWILVSGDTPLMRKMIKDFTGNEPGAREAHFAAVFVGDDRTGMWSSADGLAGPEELIKLIDAVRSGSLVKQTK